MVSLIFFQNKSYMLLECIRGLGMNFLKNTQVYGHLIWENLQGVKGFAWQ